MQRRKFLATVGSLAAGGAAAMGTGAFSNTQVNRNVSVSIVGDQNAYLGLNPTSEYTYIKDDILEIDFGKTTEAGGSGLNQEGVVSFNDLFEITNQGTRTIAVWFDDGREDISAADQYWSDGNFNQKVADQLDASAGHAKNYYNFYTEDGESGGLTENFPDPSLAPTQIDTAEFSNPVVNGAILSTGESASVDAYFGNTGDFKPGEIEDAKITIWAYSQDYAENLQS